MQRIAIIHWYGRVDMNSSFYQTYIRKICEKILKNKYNNIIASWWFTDKNTNESEAWSMMNAIKKTIDINCDRVLEEWSVTTYKNILECGKILSNFGEGEISVFCSNIHLPKVIYQSNQTYLWFSKEDTIDKIQELFKKKETTPALSWDVEILINGISYCWFDLWRNIEAYNKAIWSSIVETHYDEFENLHEDFVNYRKKIRWLK